MTYDVLIIGGGPAGVAGAVYAARKRMKTVIVTDAFGGQSVVSLDIQNFIGYTSISGIDLSEKMESQLRAQEDVEIIDGDRVVSIEEKGGVFFAKTQNGKEFEAKTILVASGSKRRKLDVPGEKEFDGKGVAYCATCDAPLFRGKKTAVVGGGNAALESARDLVPYASEVTLFVRGEEPRGDEVTLKKLRDEAKVNILTNTVITEIKGDTLVRSVHWKNEKTGEEGDMPFDGVFIEIGWLPNSDLVKGLVDLNGRGEIVVDHKTQKSSHDRIWAAGDVADVLYKQNNISMGDATKAVLNIHDYLHRNG